jgi:hypothetical protein
MKENAVYQDQENCADLEPVTQTPIPVQADVY